MSDVQRQLGAAISIAVLVGGFVFAMYYFSVGDGAPERVLVDVETLCRTDAPLERHTVLLVDTTDQLSDAQKSIVRHAIDDEARAATTYEKLSVFSMDASSPYEPRLLFAACAPKKAEDARGISENPRILGTKWARDFGDPLDEAIANEVAKGPQHQSPIVESVLGLSWQDDFASDVPHRRIVLITDGLQNSSHLTFYKRKPDFADFAGSENGRLHIPDFRGVVAEVRYLMRPQRLILQGADNQRFWADFFFASGAQAKLSGVSRTGDLEQVSTAMAYRESPARPQPPRSRARRN